MNSIFYSVKGSPGTSQHKPILVTQVIVCQMTAYPDHTCYFGTSNHTRAALASLQADGLCQYPARDLSKYANRVSFSLCILR